MLSSTTNRVLLQGGVVTNQVGYEYSDFLIFIKFLGLFSMCASSFIMRDVIHRLRRVTSSTAGGTASWRQKISLTQSIIFCLSIGDFFSSFFVQFLSTWMVPSDIPVSFASGSVASCTFQGVMGYFFYSLSASSNASLAVAYSLIVKFGWRDNDKDRHRLPFQIIPIIIATILSLVPLPGKNYNYNGNFFCDISASPYGCTEETMPCTRGINALIMGLAVGVIPFMVFFLIIIVAVIVLIYSVFKQEQRMDRYQHGDASHNRRMTNQTARQGMYYICAFGVCWIPWYIYAIIEFRHGYIPTALGVIHLTTMPLQGVFNALVYFRPKYKSDRESKPTESRLSAVLRVLRISMPTIKCCKKSNLPQQQPQSDRFDDHAINGEKKDVTKDMTLNGEEATKSDGP